MAPVLVFRAIQLLGPAAVKQASTRLGAATRTKVPNTVSGMLDWARGYLSKYPKSFGLLMGVLASLGEDKVLELLDSESEEIELPPVVSAVLHRYRTSANSAEAVARITGDGEASTVHGMEADEYVQTVQLAKSNSELLRRAVGIVGSISNLRILRDALLSLEEIDFELFEKA